MANPVFNEETMKRDANGWAAPVRESSGTSDGPVSGWKKSMTVNGTISASAVLENGEWVINGEKATVSPSKSLHHISWTIKVGWWPTLQAHRLSDLLLHSRLLRQL